MITLVTGPVRSGKSAFALELARATNRRVVYVATADVDPADAEMTARVARHRRERGDMPTVEIKENGGPSLAAVLSGAPASDVLIVDSLGTWLTAHLLALGGEAARDPLAAAADLERRAGALLPALAAMRADAVVVAEEAGWGVVPPTVLGRLFRDQLGRTAAAIAGQAERTYLVVAGFAVDLAAVGRRIG